MAQVMAIYDIKVKDWGRRRDFFPALAASFAGRVPVDDILKVYYPASVVTTEEAEWDLDDGAICSEPAIRKALGG